METQTKFKTINWFKVDDKIVKSQRTTNDREIALDRFDDGIKAKYYRNDTLIRQRGFYSQ